MTTIGVVRRQRVKELCVYKFIPFYAGGENCLVSLKVEFLNIAKHMTYGCTLPGISYISRLRNLASFNLTLASTNALTLANICWNERHFVGLNAILNRNPRGNFAQDLSCRMGLVL